MLSVLVNYNRPFCNIISISLLNTCVIILHLVLSVRWDSLFLSRGVNISPLRCCCEGHITLCCYRSVWSLFQTHLHTTTLPTHTNARTHTHTHSYTHTHTNAEAKNEVKICLMWTNIFAVLQSSFCHSKSLIHNDDGCQKGSVYCYQVGNVCD